ncbi:MAG TPA: precorrin-2 C(20)-methyltransferase [Candidatus Aquicultor sp.]|jgi:precorrin-2/cobalt-factor-2 C20-methyltransferase
MIWGKLYGLGIGPGDAELLTLKAVRILNSVDVIFAPRPAPKRDSLALAIVKPILDGTADVRELDFPMTKDPNDLDAHWNRATDEIAQILSEGKDAAFITLGDPFFYSTYIYLYECLRAKYPEIAIETVPGISSVFASASAAGVPLAIGDESVVIMPVPDNFDVLHSYAGQADTIILMKVGGKLPRLIEALAELGLEKDAVLVQRVSQASREAIIKGLSNLSNEELKSAGYLSTVIIKTHGVK